MMVVEELEARGLIDDAIITAVLGVDMTRPVFSATRCELAEFVPDVAVTERTPAAIKAALLAGMQQDGAKEKPGAAELVANLTDPEAVTAKAKAFINACLKRPAAALARDLVRDVSRRRRRAMKEPVLETPEMLPTDDYPAEEDGRLSPKTCEWESIEATR
jgi:hypothetical protein